MGSSLGGLELPKDKPIVQTTLQGVKRTWCRPVQKKKPEPMEMLSDMANDALANPTIANLRIMTFSLLSFAGLFRFDEAIHILPCHISLTSIIAKISIACSKTDRFRSIY